MVIVDFYVCKDQKYNESMIPLKKQTFKDIVKDCFLSNTSILQKML